MYLIHLIKESKSAIIVRKLRQFMAWCSCSLGTHEGIVIHRAKCKVNMAGMSNIDAEAVVVQCPDCKEIWGYYNTGTVQQACDPHYLLRSMGVE